MASDWSRSGVLYVCLEIAYGAAETAVGVMLNMCGNAGQASIVGNSLATSVESCIPEVANGNSISLDCDHPEAVTTIKQTGEEIMNEAAERCKTIREAAKGHDGDLA